MPTKSSTTALQAAMKGAQQEQCTVATHHHPRELLAEGFTRLEGLVVPQRFVSSVAKYRLEARQQRLAGL
ncbi:MAG: hypothetical protein AAGA48_37145 [Myxococcota bacterium]